MEEVQGPQAGKGEDLGRKEKWRRGRSLKTQATAGKAVLCKGFLGIPAYL